MIQPTPHDSEPKIPRPEAEAMIKMMDQQLAIQRAKLAVEKEKGVSTTARWVALMIVLLFLLGAMIWGFAKLQTVRQETSARPSPPPAAPARR